MLETGSLSPRQLNSQETPLVWDLVEALFLEALLLLDKESSYKISFCVFFFFMSGVCLWSFLSYYRPLSFQEASPESLAILSACVGPRPSAPHAWDCLSLLLPLLPCPGCCLSNLLLSVGFASSGIFLSVRAGVQVSQEHPLS